MGCRSSRGQSSEVEAPYAVLPTASSTGKRFYVHHLPNHSIVPNSLPFISAGHLVAKQYLGGRWVGGGKAPRGFASLEEAVDNFLSVTGAAKVTIHYRFQ